MPRAASTPVEFLGPATATEGNQVSYTLKVFNDSKTIYAHRDVPGYSVPHEKFEYKDTPHGPEGERDNASYNVVHFTAEERQDAMLEYAACMREPEARS